MVYELTEKGFQVKGIAFPIQTLKDANLAVLSATATRPPSDDPTRVVEILTKLGFTKYVINYDSITIEPNADLPLVDVRLTPNVKNGLAVIGYHFGSEMGLDPPDLVTAFKTVLFLQEQCYNADVPLHINQIGISSKHVVKYPEPPNGGMLSKLFGSK